MQEEIKPLSDIDLVGDWDSLEAPKQDFPEEIEEVFSHTLYVPLDEKCHSQSSCKLLNLSNIPPIALQEMSLQMVRKLKKTGRST